MRRAWAAALLVCLLGASCSSVHGAATPGRAAKASLIDRYLDAVPRLELVHDRYLLPLADGSPTAGALAGLRALRAGDVEAASRAADDLVAASSVRDGARWFADLAAYQPQVAVTLEPPWVSARTQGLALALFGELAAVLPRYEHVEAEVARSFLVEIDEGGFLRRDEGGTAYFEQFATRRPVHVLSGGLLAVAALTDHLDRVGSSADTSALTAVLDAALQWYRDQLHRFAIAADEGTDARPAYALAPSPVEVLFRLFGDSDVEVDEISIRDGVVLDVGGATDDDRAAAGFVWDAPGVQNWGERRTDSGRTLRTVVAGSGTYQHAPFTLRIDPRVAEWPVVLDIVAGPTDSPVTVEVHDGERYWFVTTLEPGGGLTSAPLPMESLAGFPTAPVYEPAHHLLVVTLLGLLAERFEDAVLGEWQATWTPGLLAVGGDRDARLQYPFLVAESAAPVLALQAGDESLHVEYPTVVVEDERLVMAYSAYGDDRVWRVYRAVSTDGGRSWTDRSRLFEDDPPRRDSAFPALVADPRDGSYWLFFTADLDGDASYDAVVVSRGTTPLEMGPPEVLALERGLDPVAWFVGDQLYVAYTLTDPGGTRLVRRAVGDDGRAGDAVVLLDHTSVAGGFYTTTRLDLVEPAMWLVSGRHGDRRGWWLFCEAPDGALGPADEPLLGFSDPMLGSWDAYRYGQTSVSYGGELLLFYNGIEQGVDEPNGMIGRAVLDLDRVRDRSRC